MLKIASMIHMKNIITIFLRHNGLESENYFIIFYIYIKCILSQKSDDDLHVSHLQFSLFSLGVLCIFCSYFKRDLQAILKNDSSVL